MLLIIGNREVVLEEADGSDVDMFGYSAPSRLFRWNQNFNDITNPNPCYTNQHVDLGRETEIKVGNNHMKGDTVIFNYERRLPTQGDTCEDLLIAMIGENEIANNRSCFEYTAPQNGVVFIWHLLQN